MFELRIQEEFSAAHQLKGYQGNCENLHGHNWKVEIVISRDSLDKLGMVMDFRDVKKLANAVLKQYDHKFLNELEEFSGVNPTTENIAKAIFENISQRLTGGVKLKRVVLWESDRHSINYYV